ncbi:MAG: thiamine diphosphokinase [Candidatus Adiutrix sp.]|jgi:thiamine pyrophosphokinase|nr:thiamine diphosphokinase [Candidatus Adiutrix sp.]
MNVSNKQAPKAYIFLNGDFEKPGHDWPARPEPDDLVIAADGGGRHPAELGWPVHCLVGDFDSLDPELMAQLVALGAEVSRHPAQKDEIDFELALMLARRRGYESIVVLGALGGRWDMTLGNLFLPRAAGWGSESIRFRHGAWDFFVISGPARLSLAGAPGDTLSLLPLGEDVHGITLSGCRYPLAGETLKAGFSRGLSNEFLAPEAELEFESGALLIIHKICYHVGSGLN